MLSARTVRLGIFATLVGMAGFSVCAFGLCPRVNPSFYFPAILAPSPLAANFNYFWYFKLPAPQEVRISSEHGLKLHGWYFRQKGATRTAILSHGIGGNMSWYLHLTRLLMDGKTSVLMYDSRGFGRSDGSATIEGMLTDGIYAYDYVAQRLKIPQNEIIFVGQSLATGVACYVSERRPCAGLILVSPYASLRTRVAEIVPFFGLFPEWYIAENGMDNRPILAKQHPPVLLIAGTKDKMLPLNQAQDLFACAIEPKQLIAVVDGTHNDLCTTHANQVRTGMTNFMNSLPVDHLGATPNPGKLDSFKKPSS